MEELQMKTAPRPETDPKTGLTKEFFSDGTLSSVGKYIAGKKTGEWKFYDAHGNLTRTKTFSIKPT